MILQCKGLSIIIMENGLKLRKIPIMCLLNEKSTGNGSLMSASSQKCALKGANALYKLEIILKIKYNKKMNDRATPRSYVRRWKHVTLSTYFSFFEKTFLIPFQNHQATKSLIPL